MRVFQQETIVRATVEALFEIIAKKVNWNRVKTKTSIERLKMLRLLFKQKHQADDLTRPGQRPGEFNLRAGYIILYWNQDV